MIYVDHVTLDMHQAFCYTFRAGYEAIANVFILLSVFELTIIQYNHTTFVDKLSK